VPEGRWRNTGKWVVTGLVALVGVSRVALGPDAPTDVLVGASVGVTLPLLAFRWFTPSQVFPIGYRGAAAPTWTSGGPAAKRSAGPWRTSWG
jgi:membrane-associated phospholipid phosphatase